MFQSSKAIPILCLLLSSPWVVKGDDDLKKRFLKEAPKGWEHQKSLREHVSYQTRQFQSATVDGKSVESAKSEIVVKSRMDGPNFAIEIYSYKPDSPLRTAFVKGKNYAFEIRRKLRTSPLVVTRFGDEMQIVETMRNTTYAYRAVGTPYELWGQDLGSLLKSPQFRITGVESLQENGDEVVQVRFECRDKSLPMQFKDGVLHLLPKYDWAVKSADFWSNDQLQIEITNDYEFDADGGFRPKSYSYLKRIPSEKYTSRNQFDYEQFSFEPSKDSYFTLTNYYLPEPGEFRTGSKGGLLRLLLIAGAIALFLVAFGLHRAARRPGHS